MVSGISGTSGWNTDCFRALVVASVPLGSTAGVLPPHPIIVWMDADPSS